MDNNTKMDHEKVIDYINVLNHNNKKYIKQIEYLTNQITILKDIHAVSDGIYTDNHDSSNKDKFMKNRTLKCYLITKRSKTNYKRP